METIKKYYKIEPNAIFFLRYITEAYEGIAICSTIDAQKGLILIRIAPGCEDVMSMILEHLKNRFMIQAISLNELQLFLSI